MLYQFDILDKWMDSKGFPRIDGRSGFQIIKGIDFEEAYKAGSITFKDDGVYLEYDGKEYRGYMFIKEPYIESYGTYPKFHLTKCSKIQEFILNGRFKVRYEWSNSNVNDLVDKTSRQKYKDEVLDLCSFCSKEIHDAIDDTEDFFESLDKSKIEEENIEVDIFGYVKEKEKISKVYREKKDYTCESCGISCERGMHKRYWHVHHKDGDKTNNKERNLECLCVKCHASKDARHESNFSNSKWKRELEAFIELYG